MVSRSGIELPMKTVWLVIGLLAFPSMLRAEDVVQYSGMTYLGCRNIGDASVWLTNPNDYATVKPGFIYIPLGCASVTPSIPIQHRKVVDTNADTIPDTVVEMTQAEKDVVDAPGIAEAARQAAFESEVTSNDLCTAELSDIVSRVETRRTTLRAAVESQRVTNNTTISSAANTVAGVKSAMTTVNNATAAEFGQTVDELASLATKIAKCVRGRAR